MKDLILAMFVVEGTWDLVARRETRWLGALGAKPELLFVHSPLQEVLRDHHGFTSLWIHIFPQLCHDQTVDIENSFTRHRCRLEAWVGSEECCQKRELFLMNSPKLHHITVLAQRHLTGIPGILSFCQVKILWRCLEKSLNKRKI